MPKPVTRLGKEDMFFRALRKMLEDLPRTYELEITISGDITRINIILGSYIEGEVKDG